ncbi:MAG: hypothetical protein OXU79_11825 [Gemmatimonadota bacterium]|nr:hypothetical protein [Gemmatimonadota bacterium]
MGAVSNALLVINRFLLRQKKNKDDRVKEDVMATLTPFEPDEDDYAAADRVIADIKAGKMRPITKKQMKEMFPKSYARQYGSDS